MWEKVQEVIKEGNIFENLGKGTSQIYKIDDEKIIFIRGKSKITFFRNYLESVYKEYHGQMVTTTKLKEFLPEGFSSKHKGHDCNCTFLFVVLNEIGFVKDGFHGKGVKGNPFYINLL